MSENPKKVFLLVPFRHPFQVTEDFDIIKDIYLKYEGEMPQNLIWRYIIYKAIEAPERGILDIFLSKIDLYAVLRHVNKGEIEKIRYAPVVPIQIGNIKRITMTKPEEGTSTEDLRSLAREMRIDIGNIQQEQAEDTQESQKEDERKNEYENITLIYDANLETNHETSPILEASHKIGEKLIKDAKGVPVEKIETNSEITEITKETITNYKDETIKLMKEKLYEDQIDVLDDDLYLLTQIEDTNVVLLPFIMKSTIDSVFAPTVIFKKKEEKEGETEKTITNFNVFDVESKSSLKLSLPSTLRAKKVINNKSASIPAGDMFIFLSPPRMAEGGNNFNFIASTQKFWEIGLIRNYTFEGGEKSYFMGLNPKLLRGVRKRGVPVNIAGLYLEIY